MRRSFFKSYLSFSKRERQGIIVLLILIAGVLTAPYLFPSLPETEATDLSAFQQAVKQLGQQAPGVRPGNNKRERSATGIKAPAAAHLFYFDPNHLSPRGWAELGVEEKTILTIQHYLAKGGHFYTKEALQKIYGLHPEEYERLAPYIRIEPTGQKTFREKREPEADENNAASNAAPLNHITRNINIEINSADTAGFILLRGIGSRLAGRIVKFRDKLGGFATVDQIGEVYGLPDSVFSGIKSHLTVNDSLLRRININTADVKILQQHPYISYNLANSIVQYRRQHGVFGGVEDIKSLALVDEEIYRKIAPYLAVE
ncbi:MAG TPA: helix-hairpin-helix domain-containing protein [Chitinophagaceae bacterium]